MMLFDVKIVTRFLELLHKSHLWVGP